MNRLYNVGDAVMLLFGPEIMSLGVTPELRQMEERIFYVSKVRTISTHAVYELEGCKSKAGVPFTITADWLMPYNEVRR